MEKLHFHSVLYPLCFLQFLIFSSAYTPTFTYFINCGSDSTVNLGDRTFTGDLSSGSFSAGRNSQPIRNDNPLPDTSPLYQTARIYREPSEFELRISFQGSYLVRFHFFAFSSGGTNLADALFNVSTSNFALLSNFRVGNSSNSPVIKEFFLNISAGKFIIYFTPAGTSSFAFVNAIEVILLPQDFVTDLVIVPPSGTQNGSDFPPLGTRYGTMLFPLGTQKIDSFSLQLNALQTLYRINVGGPAINDTLWRNWVRDDGYLIVVGSARSFSSDVRLGSVSGPEVEEINPELMYKTCKVVNLSDSEASNSANSNTTWRFSTGKRARHVVRLHFCDIVSESPGKVRFNLFVNTKFRSMINITLLAVPFYNDLVVDSDDSGYMNISIAPDQDSPVKIAYLNGLEIMEIVENTTMAVPKGERPSKHLFLIIGLIVGLGLLSISAILCLLVLRWRRAKPLKASVSKVELPYGRGRSHGWTIENAANPSPVVMLNLKLKMSFAEIQAATQNFDTKLLIGEGGFGKVYKGTLGNGMKVAVKRSDSNHGQGLPEFQTEVLVLSKIQHRHLVSLIGYCDEGDEMILVYEFMEKGTLRDHLYAWKENPETSSAISELTWKQRLEICIGAAKGLHYLHTGADEGIIHRDVKSTNILLDEYYVAKVADFGLSQQGPSDPDHFSTGLKGSFGYLDPEYFKTLQLTTKSDVYSFGVVLCEVLCARLPIVNSPRREEVNLAEWVLVWQTKGQLEKVIDPSLAGHINPNSLRKFGEIAEKCLKPEGADRPTMVDICWDLEYALQLQQTAIQREPHEDSRTDTSSALLLPLAQRVNADSLPIEEETFLFGGGDDSFTNPSGVFSQMSIDGAR